MADPEAERRARASAAPPAAGRSVRDAAFDILRQCGVTTLFANPGTTELALLAALPDDFTFVLGLQEGALVGMATGYALGGRAPAVALLHTAAGLGNAVGAIATARVNGVPLVVLVGQQDRRHLDTEPFLAGRLQGMAGDYPVDWIEPSVPQQVPGALRRAFHRAALRRGPAVVVVPMGDWTAAYDDAEPLAAPRRLIEATSLTVRLDAELLASVRDAANPAIVVGAGADSASGWAAVQDLAEATGAAIFQDTFSPQLGVPHAHPRYCGVLPGSRSARRERLGAHDVVLVLGTSAFRGFHYEAGPFVEARSRLIVITDDADEAARSAADLAVVGPLPMVLTTLASQMPVSGRARSRTTASLVAGAPSDASGPGRAGLAVADDAPLEADTVIGLLDEIIPADCVVFEEAPSFRHRLVGQLNREHPRTFFSAAMGGLGFAAPACIGMRLANGERHVAAVVGDGSILYTVQALWTAAHYHVGATIFVLANGGYAVMDRQATEQGHKPAWPGFGEISVADLSASLGCPSTRVETAGQLRAIAARWDGPSAGQTEPIVVEVRL
jgi:benzoylformate decarboxylase